MGKAEEHAGPFRLGGDGLDAAEELEARADHLGQTLKDLGQVAARLLLNGHGHGQKAQILTVHAFGKGLEAFGHVAAIGGLVGDQAEFGAQGIGHLFRHDADGR